MCGSCEQAYEDILRELEKKDVIVYHGLVKNIKDIMPDITCTIHPTYYAEGMSNVLLESCASARPIITTNRPGCREIIDDGINGFICKQQDSEDLIKQIEKFMALSQEERKQMGLNGRKKVEQYFDRNIVVNKYIMEIHS